MRRRNGKVMEKLIAEMPLPSSTSRALTALVDYRLSKGSSYRMDWIPWIKQRWFAIEIIPGEAEPKITSFF